MKKVRLFIVVLLLAAAALATMDAPDQAASGQAYDQASVSEPADLYAATESITCFAQPETTPAPTATAAAPITELKAEIIQEPTPEPSLIEEPAPDPTPEPIIFTQKEKKLIARVVYAESRGEKFEGQVAVAQVVINRYLSGKFGRTVKRVVFAPHQFAVGKRYNDENMRAVETAIKKMSFPKTMFFFQVSKSKHWRNFIYYRRIGNHSFYLAGK